MMPCARCGAPAAKTDFAIGGMVEFSIPACGACVEIGERGIAGARVTFDALIARGVDRRMANRIMIERIQRGEYGALKRPERKRR